MKAIIKTKNVKDFIVIHNVWQIDYLGKDISIMYKTYDEHKTITYKAADILYFRADEKELIYQLMEKGKDGQYHPNYEELKRQTEDLAELEYIEKMEARKITFAFNMLVIMQQGCGHYEAFQHPCNEYHPMEESLTNLKSEANKRGKCTRCVCNW